MGQCGKKKDGPHIKAKNYPNPKSETNVKTAQKINFLEYKLEIVMMEFLTTFFITFLITHYYLPIRIRH